MSARVERLVQETAALTTEERREFLRRLGQGLVRRVGDIRDLNGLGREVWGAVDAQSYLDAERDAWDPPSQR